MLDRLNTILGISNEDLEKKGVFNSFVYIDSSLYVDPSLLENLKIPEFKDSYKNFQKYFQNIIILIEKIKNENDIFWFESHKKLQFKEFKYVGLGYSSLNKNGNAIGPKLARDILRTAREIISEGVKDPVIFELVGLIQKNISLDRISDMTIHIIKEELLRYTQRVSQELKIDTKEFNFFKSRFRLPFNPTTNEPIIFLPNKILRDIPIAYCWEDIETVSSQTESLKKEVNEIIGKSWKEVISDKKYLRSLLLENKSFLNDFIIQYKKKPREPYNFKKDPKGEFIWLELSDKAVSENPVDLTRFKPITEKNIKEVVNNICLQYSKLIENNGWFEFLYNDKDHLRNERFAQKLFYGIADMYCKANDLNLSRESNAGVGALDFKISSGYSTVVTVELKYSSNTNLYKGYTIQLPTYNKAENAKYGFYLVLKTNNNDNTIKRIQEEYSLATKRGEIAPEIIIVDARRKVSASKRQE